MDNTPSEPDIAKIAAIAARMCPEHQCLLLGAHCSVPRTNDEWSADCICSAGNAIDHFVAMGLAVVRNGFPNGVVLTPLGRQVAAHLKEPTP